MPDTITAADLRAQLEAGGAPLLLDVREPAELVSKLGALDGALNIPLRSLGLRLTELACYRNRELVIVCRSGRRAVSAAELLRSLGFSNVSVLEGGMLAWRELPQS